MKSPALSTSAHKPPVTTNMPITPTRDQLSKAEMYMRNFENIIADGKEPNMTKEYQPQVALEMEQYLNPQKLRKQVLHSEKVQQIISYYAEKQKTSRKVVEQQAEDIINEISLERNLPIIRWCGMAITAIGKRILNGIYVNNENIAKVREKMGKHQVLYLPSHRSYMDFILMSYICYYYDVEIPGIAAGMDFHSMFGIGTMLRKTGAFFMRRSFSNDELYWDIFREYMYQLVTSYHIGVEFFIEGTRSRNFKALVPKIGLLSMALLPYFTGEASDITIVPVSVSYERVLEEQLFVYELLGVPKPKESTKGFFKALKIIDERFGKMYMDFGTPISVREFFHHTGLQRIARAQVGAHLQILNKNEVELVKKLANEVVYQQQRRIVITTFNLISLFYAKQLYAKRSVNIDELAEAVKQLKLMFEALGAHVATDLNCLKPEIIKTIEIHSNIVYFRNARLEFTQVAAEQLAQEIDVKRLKAHALAPNIMAVAVPTLALQLYINPCLFWLARPAYLILAALQLQKEQLDDGGADMRSNNAEMILELLEQRALGLEEIFKHEFIIDSVREKEEFMKNFKYLEDHSIVSICKQTGKIILHENEYSCVILSALAPFICIYYQLAVTLNQLPSEAEISQKDILVRMQQHIEQLLQQPQSLYVHPYCLALDNLNIAIQSFQQSGYIVKNKSTGLYSLTSSTKSLAQLEKQLLNYCQLLPFSSYNESINLQLTANWNLSKL